MNQFVDVHCRRVIVALAVAFYLKFLLLPTASLFYELHHLTGVDAVYWGYSVFKAAGYYFGNWSNQTLACVVVAVLIIVPWREAYRALKSNREKEIGSHE